MSKFEMMVKGYEESIAQFDAYRQENANVEVCTKAAPVETILRFWAENKHSLWNMMGQELILRKTISYNRDVEELRAEMERMVSTHRSFVNHFMARLQEELGLSQVSDWRDYAYDNERGKAEEFYYGVRAILNAWNLVEARVDQNISATICGERVSFAVGQKSMRALGKLARILGLNEEFEAFRVAHSMVLNQAKLTGELCLSIHPLDFATASDNESGWSSCMSWRERGGYRLGTVEMMNSGYVICAYLSSDSVHMDIGDGTWNSKKWRAWVIVDKDFIVVNRNYPYDNSDLCKACVEWVKEMAQPFFGVTYDAVSADWNQGDPIEIGMNFMYNDLGDEHIGCYNVNVHEGEYERYLNISGEAVCQWCGEVIDYEGDDDCGADSLTCCDCGGRLRCACCGTGMSRDYAYWGPDDEPYCECCYGDRFYSCDHCGDVVDSDDTYSVCIPVDMEWVTNTLFKEHPELSRPYVSNELCIRVCKDCLTDCEITPNQLEWDARLPFRRFSHGWWNSGWNGEMIDPAVSWENVAELFGVDKEDELWKPVWEHYCTARLAFEF